MAGWIDFRNSAESRSTLFRSENLRSYLALRVLTMCPPPPYEHPNPSDRADWRSVEWLAELTSETQLKYINVVQIRTFEILPSPESFDNVSAPALQIPQYEWPSRLTICGIAGWIDFRNSAEVHQHRSDQKFWDLTLLWELWQCIHPRLTNTPIWVTEKIDDLWNGSLNWHPKLS